MIKTVDVFNAINKDLEQWFGYTVYIDTMPQDFERPSFYLAFESGSVKDMNRRTVERTMTFRVICYAQKDERFNSDTLALIDLMEQVCGIYEGRKLAVSDRQLNITSEMATDKENDVMYVSLKTIFADDRGTQKAEYLTMESIETRFKEER